MEFKLPILSYVTKISTMIAMFDKHMSVVQIVDDVDGFIKGNYYLKMFEACSSSNTPNKYYPITEKELNELDSEYAEDTVCELFELVKDREYIEAVETIHISNNEKLII